MCQQKRSPKRSVYVSDVAFQENSGSKDQGFNDGSLVVDAIGTVDTLDTEARASMAGQNQDMVSWLHDMGTCP